MKQPGLFDSEDDVPVVRLEELLASRRVSVSTTGKLSGDVSGHINDPSTWKHKDGWVVMRSTYLIKGGRSR